MLKRDYIKEIENSLKIVRKKVDESIIKKNKESAEEAINKELRGLVGLDLATINSLDFDSIKEIISREREYNSEKYIALAELLRLNGMLQEDINEKIYYYNRALMAYYEGINDEELLLENYKKYIEEVMSFVSQYELTVKENIILVWLYECMGRYDKAEDILFMTLKHSNNDEMVIEKGIDFYNRLMNADEKKLEAGNLSHEEVLDGLNVFKSKNK